jgi:cbb3-type cytochrome oxidase subunit 3
MDMLNRNELIGSTQCPHLALVRRIPCPPLVGVLFSMWVTFAAGYQSVYQSLIIVLIGVVLYAFLKARRENPSAPAGSEPSSASQQS